MTDLKKIFGGKKVLIWGLGLHGGGLGAAVFFHKLGAKVVITDLRDKKTLAPTLKKLAHLKNISYILGEHREGDFANVDFVVRNPAIKDDNPYLSVARKNKVPVISDVGLFLQYSPALIIGITGSKGKSTLTQLIYELLSEAARSQKGKLEKVKKIFLGGNIRISVFDALEKAKEDDIVVLELSSFQLDHASYTKKSPHIAIVTNLYNEHINYHGSLKKYEEAKKNILRFQKKNNLAILNKNLKKWGSLSPAIKIFFDGTAERGLLALAEYFGIKREKVEKKLKNFKGLEGRQEIVAKSKKGVIFINDTTATHPEATIFALKKFENPILIAGGVDKKFGQEVDALARLIDQKKLQVALLPGDFSDRLEKKCRTKFFHASDMEQAVCWAKDRAKPGDIVLLSPGSASFNLFLNEFDRGEKFVRAIKSCL
ncbi:UDP-N-acetylmuramoyl-L-alanine--D-glutamate ligase [Candidatus Microgenomates bacterium]|nr:UDP-N-acetylmuramoyl-L-alanine--D-glutamate ligase [Candidatus Microgenomates bacterium]